ncbi:MAG: stage II sporulation protein E, partial [Bacteroidetes bacterium HGW-Bacteroidetes-22]
MPANLKNAFLETGWSQLSKAGNQVCGDTILTRRIQSENRYVAVLSDGLGSGIRASVLSTMTAGMALNFTLCHEPVKRTAETIMRTLPVDSKRNISYSTFTILDVDCQGDMSIVEYDNPPLFLIRNLEIIFPQREDVAAEGPAGFKTMHLSQLSLQPGDRIVVVSDGVVQSGIGGAVTPFGWE